MTHAENFRNFLMENGAYEGYCKALLNQTGISFNSAIVGRQQFNNIIDKSFTWDKTKEDQDYWSVLNVVWNNALAQGKQFTAGYKSIW